MFHNANPRASQPRPTARHLAWAGALALAVAILASGCEDKAIGRTCDLRSDASVGAAQGAYAIPATDCPSRICIKPAVQPGVSNDLNTGPYCTAECTADSDCVGQTRDFTNGNDRRCMKGFTCAIPFDSGKLCCQKLCLCRDFFSASVGPATPEVCQNNAGKSCS